MTPEFIKKELRELARKGEFTRPCSPYGQLGTDYERSTALAREALKYIDQLLKQWEELETEHKRLTRSLANKR